MKHVFMLTADAQRSRPKDVTSVACRPITAPHTHSMPMAKQDVVSIYSHSVMCLNGRVPTDDETSTALPAWRGLPFFNTGSSSCAKGMTIHIGQ